MLIPVEHSELCQISLTGARAIVLFGLLIEKPRSLEEIRDAFIELKLIEQSHSNDIIRIDMNTLKAIGCTISRSCAKTNFKYKLISHPFLLNIEKDEVQMLKKAYKLLKENANISTLININSLFEKISNFVSDSDIKEELLGISILNSCDIQQIKELENDCKLNSTLEILYKSPVAKFESKKKIVAQKIIVRNDKIYLLCFDIIKDYPAMLPVKRILKVISRESDSKNIIKNHPVYVKFYLKNFTAAGILDEEKIIKTNADCSCEIEGEYHNEFMAIQRILSFGSSCIVIEPEDIKQKVIEKLLEMREIYKND